MDAQAKDTAEVVYSESSISEAVSTGDETSLPQRLLRLNLGQAFLSESSVLSSGLLLGITMATMLLGHWYLNSPTMEMAPLRRLIVLMALAVVLRTIFCSLGLWGEFAYANSFSTQWIAFITIRWTFGLLGVAILTWMAWQTLKIPNTQSATAASAQRPPIQAPRRPRRSAPGRGRSRGPPAPGRA